MKHAVKKQFKINPKSMTNPDWGLAWKFLVGLGIDLNNFFSGLGIGGLFSIFSKLGLEIRD